MRPFSAALLLALTAAVPSQDKWDVTQPPGPSRPLSFSVTTGTWMSCDVHPKTSEIVFDLLGDIYVLPFSGGDAQCVRKGPSWDMQPRWSPDGESILFTSDAGGGDNLWVMSRDGSAARAVTEETFRLVCNPRWHPSGQWVVGRKHFTKTRSLGAGEMWLYPLNGGPGVGLTEKRNDQQDANEPAFSPDGRFLYWSEDVSGGSTFEYNKDPNGEIYAIQRKDLESGEVRRFVSGAGGSIRPEPSPDGRHLAFIRRVRTQTVLFVRDLATSEDRVVFDGLSRDSQETWAIHGVYPAYAWTPDNQSLVIWSQGGLWRIQVADGSASPIPFRVHVDLTIAETLRVPTDFGGETVRTQVCRWPAVSPSGNQVVFQALGRLYRRDTASDAGPPVPITPEGVMAMTPSWSPDGSVLAYTTWDDVEGGRVRLLRERDQRIAGDRDLELVSQPGHYLYPSFSPDGNELVYQRLRGDGVRGSRWTQEPGIYLVPVAGGKPRRITDKGERPRFSGRGDRILFETQDGDDRVLVSVDRAGHDERELARGRYATEFAISRDGRWLAFTHLWNAYVCPLPPSGQSLTVSAELDTVPCVRLSRDAGQDLAFSNQGTHVVFGLGNRCFQVELAPLFDEPLGAKESDVEPESHQEDRATVLDLAVESPAYRPTGSILLRHARIITMVGDQVIADGAILVAGDRIQQIGADDEISGWDIPNGTVTMDFSGQFILPGFVDVHAHIQHGSSGIIPERNWQHLANLSFGVTTTHDPSNDTRTTFATAELQRTGAILAPRIFSTGTILYGADGDFKAVVNSLDDARSHIRRTQAFGAQSVKSYNQPRRDQRQQVMAAARELGVNVVPEGGSTLQHNLTHLVDGHTTLEHALPVAPAYDDILNLFSACGTAYTPTLIVGYGGIWGENWFYAKDQVWSNDRLLRWMPRHVLDARSRRRTVAPDEEYHHVELARTAAEIVRRGGNVEVGAHGQIQGLGVHWEMRMFEQGGLSPHDALRTGTLWAARALGMDHEVGSLAAGMRADLIVLPEDPLAAVAHAESLSHVMIAGRLLDARTLDEIHPEPRPLPKGPWLGPGIGEAQHVHGCHCGRSHN